MSPLTLKSIACQKRLCRHLNIKFVMILITRKFASIYKAGTTFYPLINKHKQTKTEHSSYATVRKVKFWRHKASTSFSCNHQYRNKCCFNRIVSLSIHLPIVHQFGWKQQLSRQLTYLLRSQWAIATVANQIYMLQK